ncbi:helix-turn-helix domain-containing protein [Acerihabitans arboris]|uniref:Helix-turn-helix domain-containing protein n=1 Tax=Acerihabitans arboris TaxID=2691583 RepID=A0A845SFJ8_9GAMM|nr:AraC family transcriptional regulator [Acerihabitans arboris]NDL62649.1 helix-turn-helix domain-containing protein [Acerihabitans arboris]
MRELKPNEPLVAALAQWIEDHLDRDIALPELAARSGYSVWHMQGVFRATTGIAVGRYIRERKLTEAVHRLRNSDNKIIDIALDYGFNSQSQFTTLFKKYFGITPQACRNDRSIILPLTPPLRY